MNIQDVNVVDVRIQSFQVQIVPYLPTRVSLKGQIPGQKGQLVVADSLEEINMVMTDPIADMLTRIRNANQMRNETISMPS